MSKINGYVKNISPLLYQELRLAVEIGKWKDGNLLTEQQKADTLQLVLAYQNEFNGSPEHFTIAKNGEIYMEKKSILRTQFTNEAVSDTHKIDLY